MRCIVALMLMAFAWPALADDKKAPPQTAGVPIEAKLVVGKSDYTVDLEGKTPEAFAKMLKENAKTNPRQMPAPPAVDIKLVLKNTSDKPIQVYSKGDQVTLNFILTGDGAVTVTGQQAFTREFRLPVAVKIEPGKTFEIPLQNLAFGFRGIAERAYWTKAGEYELQAYLVTAVSPAPPKVEVEDEGFGKAILVAPPVKLKVTELK